MERILQPGEYSIFMETGFGVEDIDDDFFSIIEVLKDGECIQRYAEEVDGYLLVDENERTTHRRATTLVALHTVTITVIKDGK